MTTPPSNEQNNDSGHNINLTGDNNVIHVNSNNSSGFQSQFPQSKSLREHYNDLPSDEDRARFRALGVLPPDVMFDGKILSRLWQAPHHKTDVYIYILRENELLLISERDLYYQTLDMHSRASILLHEVQGDFARNLKNYADACLSLALGLDTAIHHKRYNMYFEHISEVIRYSIGALQDWDGDRKFGLSYLPKFAKILYPLGRTWYGLKNWQNAVSVFRKYDDIASTLIEIEDKFYDPIRHGTTFFEMSDSYSQLSDFLTAIHYLEEYIVHLESIDVELELEKAGFPSLEEAEKYLLELRKRAKTE